MERHFDEELKKLKENIITMSLISQDMIEDAIIMLKERKSELKESVFEKERKLNMIQIEIDNIAFKLIVLRQPAAGDLRFLISAIKINSDLERIGDLAVNIVERNQELLKELPLKPLIGIPRMAKISQKMVHDAIDSFINRKAELAQQVCCQDDIVDNLNEQIFRELLTYMLQDTKNITRAISLTFISKYLERIADHATNIGEDVYYMVEGKDIRHHSDDYCK
ncbi:MAG: phosphate signaling complex protein PhoU [Candidatus Omnitrophica bacterium]|jgi:phosphate transport system protein|nr:phosphate signaling complex protein PhoU [Candidatus Omnitrophota bacterium]